MRDWLEVRQNGDQNEIWLAPAGVDLTATQFPQGLRLLGRGFEPGEDTTQALASLDTLFQDLDDSLQEKPAPWEGWAMRYLDPGSALPHYLRFIPGWVDLEGAGWSHGVSMFHESLAFGDHRSAEAAAKEVTAFMNHVAQAFTVKPKPRAPSP